MHSCKILYSIHDKKKEYNDVKQRKTHYRISLLQAQKGEEGVGREARGREGREGGRAVLFETIFWYQSFDFVVKKILLFPKVELVFAESTV